MSIRPESSATSSPEMRAYVARFRKDAADIVRLASGTTDLPDLLDPSLQRSLHMEATALACFWIKSFSEEKPSMQSWAGYMSAQVVSSSSVPEAFDGTANRGTAADFLAERECYFRDSGATWKFSEALLSAWMSVIHHTLLAGGGIPPRMAPGTSAASFRELDPPQAAHLSSLTGIDCLSPEHRESIARLLKEFIGEMAIISNTSHKAHVDAVDSPSPPEAGAAGAAGGPLTLRVAAGHLAAVVLTLVWLFCWISLMKGRAIPMRLTGAALCGGALLAVWIGRQIAGVPLWRKRFQSLQAGLVLLILWYAADRLLRIVGMAYPLSGAAALVLVWLGAALLAAGMRKKPGRG